jgi:hypothetical protein
MHSPPIHFEILVRFFDEASTNNEVILMSSIERSPQNELLAADGCKSLALS